MQFTEKGYNQQSLNAYTEGNKKLKQTKQTEQLTACRRKTSIGGQALLEGIMMRGPKVTALAVRNTKGEIVTEDFPTKGRERGAFFRLPVIRGIFGYIDSMTIGYKCLMRSAELSGLEDVVEESPKKKKKRLEAEAAAREAAGEENPPETLPEAPAETEEKPTETEEKTSEEEKLPAWVMTVMMIGSVVLALALCVGLFLFLPTFLYDLVAGWIPGLKGENAALNSLWKSIFEGVLKVALLVGYMAAISFMKDIRRTFMFHGAEHKTIFCYEAGLELTVENVKKQKRFHPRCGTSFLVLMVLVSIFISFFIDPIAALITGEPLVIWLRVAVKLLLLPLIVGLGYELIKLAGRHDNLFTRIISAPGVWLQHITVFEPTDDMIECAITAVKMVIPDDESDKW